MIGKREFPSSLFNYLSFANKNYTLTAQGLCQVLVPILSVYQQFMKKNLSSMGFECAGMRCAYFAHPYRCVLN